MGLDLKTLIHSPQAQYTLLVVTAADLQKLLEDAIAWGMSTIKERDEPKFYTREELLDLLHVSNPTLMSYRKRGLIPEPVTIDGRVLFDKAEVRTALAEGKLKNKIIRRQ